MYQDPTNGFADGGAVSPITLSAANQQVATPTAPTLSTPSVAVPTAAPGATGQSGPGFFQEGGGAGLALGAIQTLGSLWNSFQQNKLAKKSLSLQTKAFETNLANQTKTYNTALEDRINARYATEGRSGEAQSYIDKNKL